MIRVQCVFGRAPSPADARTRFEIDESAWVEDLQDMLEKKYTQMAQQPTRMLWKVSKTCQLGTLADFSFLKAQGANRLGGYSQWGR